MELFTMAIYCYYKPLEQETVWWFFIAVKYMQFWKLGRHEWGGKLRPPQSVMHDATFLSKI